MSRVALICVVVFTAAVAWLSQGTTAFTGVGPDRIALLPVSAPAWLIVVAAAAAVVIMRTRGASLAPCGLLVLLLLPWLPRAPAAFLMWSGPLAILVWLGVGLSSWPRLPASAWSVTRPHVAAGVLACVVYSTAAWLVSPSVPGGDEPHYLIITQSLLSDHDLKIENNHRRGDYQAYYPGDLSQPHFRRRGRDGEIYSVHSPGISVLIAPAFALAGYPGVVIFLIALSSVGSALAWHLSWRVTGDRASAWFGWAAVTLSTTEVFQSFTIFPDGLGGIAVLTGVWALLRAQAEASTRSERLWPWLLHGAALAVLPWMHPRLAVTAGSLGGLVLLRLASTPHAAGKAVAFLGVPAVSALGWLGFYVAIYGTPDPSAPFGDEIRSVAFIPGAIAGLLFDQRFGLLAYAPVLAFAIGGLGLMIRDREHRRLALELLFLVTPYLLVVTHVAMWWGGSSAPARFLAPVLLPMAIPAACAWHMMRHRTARVTAIASLVFTVFATGALVSIDGGRLAFNTRESYAYWLEWLTGTADLAHGLPAWWRDREPQLFRDIGIWSAALAAGWVLLRALERRPWVRTRGAFCALAGAVYAIAGMVAMSIVWGLAGVTGILTTPGQLQALRRISSEPRLLALTLAPPRRVAVPEVPGRVRIEPPPALELGAAGRTDRPLYALPGIPAGRYRLLPRTAGEGGWLMVGIGRDQFALRTQPIGVPPEPIVLDFPVNVRAIVVKGDEQARRSLRGLLVEPLSVVLPGSRLTSQVATRGVRYGTSSAFFLDDRSFAEPEAFWIGGNRESSVVIQPDASTTSLGLLLRNAPVDNTVSVTAGAWREELRLAPGDERRVQIPFDGRHGAALITVSTSAGFRPSAVDPKSRDNRFLGVWVRVLQ